MQTSPAFSGLIRLLRKSRLSIRLSATFLIISLLPSLVLALFSNRIYANSITGVTSAAVKQSLQLLNNNVNLVLSEYSSYLDKLSVSADLQDFLYARHFGGTTGSTFSANSSAFSFVATPKLRSAVILDAGGEMLVNKGIVNFSMSTIPDILAATDALSPKDYVTHCKTMAGQDCLAMCRKIYDSHYSRVHVGYLLLFLDGSTLAESVMPTTSMGEGADIFIINSAEQPVAFQSPEILENTGRIAALIEKAQVPDKAKAYTGEIADKDNLIVYVYSSRYKLYMFSVVPYTSLNRDVNWVKGLILAVTALLLVICLALSLLTYFSVITPINAAVAVCRRAEGGGVPVIRDAGQDELALMSNSIDSLIINNRRVMTELKKSDEEKRELEIEMLKFQLNPHFLFNTLNTFKWIADINCLYNLRDGIASMADLLRSTLVQKQELITLQAETDNLKSYCTIQNLRYAGQFEVAFALDAEALGCYVPRFILQPLVENAIVHGIRNKEDVLHITVSGSVSEDMLSIAVGDDGIGFDVSTVIDAESGSFKGIGLANVDKRVRLYYGEGCRLSITSRPGEGTVCSLTIPAKKQQEDTQ